ncbi:hypothetical protein WHR41_01485 [Cladosporium halotolerans]|uniref:Conserved oligomeric Golgi complex subunit 2 n=1 Tax=Cladosporium halotolerans TaxID=1052096 RepID=A0AB34KXK2_9PEZI
MSKFFIDSTSQSADTTPAHVGSPSFGSDDEDTLPYPAELARNDFLSPNFDAQEYLSSLRNRHQTLEDLRSDLRGRSQLLNRELLDLVNGNYEEFLSLGGGLKGGEEKVEGVTVGLLGFQREVETIRKAVQERARETGDLLQEKKGLRKEVVLGRALLEVNEKLEELEERLGIKSKDEEDDEEDDEDEDDDDEASSAAGNSVYAGTLRRLGKQSEQYLSIVRQCDRIGTGHPFLVSLQPRIDEVRKTIILDLSASLRQAKSLDDKRAVLGLTQVFAAVNAENDALRVLKGS